MLSHSHARKITIGFLLIFTISMTPPVVYLVDAPTTVFGINQLYLWTAVWAILVSLVLVWAAWRSVFALSEDQVPPELRDTDVMTDRSGNAENSTTRGSE